MHFATDSAPDMCFSRSVLGVFHFVGGLRCEKVCSVRAVFEFETKLVSWCVVLVIFPLKIISHFWGPIVEFCGIGCT